MEQQLHVGLQHDCEGVCVEVVVVGEVVGGVVSGCVVLLGVVAGSDGVGVDVSLKTFAIARIKDRSCVTG